MTLKQRLVDLYKHSLYESIVLEGGNALDKVNSVVPVEALHPTIVGALESVGLGSIEYDIVGNASKAFLGDIDISVSLADISQAYKIESIKSPEDFWKELNFKLTSFGVEYTINKGFSQFHILAPVVDETDRHLDAVDSQGNISNGVPGLVQIDVFVGNKEWMKNILSGSPGESKFKAVYRNLLLVSIVSNFPSDEPDTKYSMNFRDGLKVVKYSRLPSGRTKNLESKVIISSADDLSEWLFGVPWSEINSFEKLWNELLSPTFEHQEIVPKILQDYRDTLIKANKELPDELVTTLDQHQA
jgi:hypothetical protein